MLRTERSCHPRANLTPERNVKNETFKITPETSLAAPCWLWHEENKEWVDSETLGDAGRFAPHVFGFTHWRQKPDLEEVIREAVSWVQNRLAVEGHPLPRFAPAYSPSRTRQATTNTRP